MKRIIWWLGWGKIIVLGVRDEVRRARIWGVLR
jgi:hypothetical protein